MKVIVSCGPEKHSWRSCGVQAHARFVMEPGEEMQELVTSTVSAASKGCKHGKRRTLSISASFISVMQSYSTPVGARVNVAAVGGFSLC